MADFFHFLAPILAAIFAVVYFAAKEGEVKQFALYSYTVAFLVSLMVFAK